MEKSPVNQEKATLPGLLAELLLLGWGELVVQVNDHKITLVRQNRTLKPDGVDLEAWNRGSRS